MMQRYNLYSNGMRPDSRGSYVLFWVAEEKIQSLREALCDCMSYIDVDNLTLQTKKRNWQAALDGGVWNPANVRVSK